LTFDHRRSWHGPPPFSNFLFTNLFSIKFLYFFIISSLFPYFNLFVSIFIQSYVNIKLHVSTLLDTNTGARGTDHPPFSNFLFTNLFSIKFLYFFIISSLFPYFNLFVSIFIQSYVNIKLHVSTLYSIYLLTGYEGIASLLSLRHWLLTEAKPRSIVRVEGATNLLFPNTVYKYFIMPKNIRLIVEWSPQNDKDQ
jgi:hypothetical protein